MQPRNSSIAMQVRVRFIFKKYLQNPAETSCLAEGTGYRHAIATIEPDTSK